MDPTQIILIVFIVLLIILYPILISVRNKKERQKMQEQTNSLKRGDKVLTTSGVYGTIVDLHLEEDKKIVTIETGTDKKKGYISVDAYAIYTVFKDEPQESKEETVNVPESEVKAQDKEVKTDNKAQTLKEEGVQTPEEKVEDKKEEKKSKNK